MEGDEPVRNGGARFLTTRWSLVRSAAGVGESARRSLEELCRAYWFPLYAFLRRRGTDPVDAEDLVQAFFVLLLERGDLGAADPERGRFRSWIRVALKHFVAGEVEKSLALKRGGGSKFLSIDRDAAEKRLVGELASERTPEREFDRAWAMATLDRAKDRLRTEYAGRGKGELFEALQGELVPASGGGGDRAALAGELGLTAGALKVAVHRLRQRFGEALRSEVGETLGSEAEVDDEIAVLREALGD